MSRMDKLSRIQDSLARLPILKAAQLVHGIRLAQGSDSQHRGVVVFDILKPVIIRH